MEQKQTFTTIILSANDGSPLIRKATRMYRKSCQNSSDIVRWLPPRKLFARRVKPSSLPPSWLVTLENVGTVCVKPDMVIGFEVLGSVPRVLWLCLDTGTLPVIDSKADSLFLRTQALDEARQGEAREQLLSAQTVVLWIMRTTERLEQLHRSCKDMFWIAFVDEETFFRSPDVLSLALHHSRLPTSPIV